MENITSLLQSLSTIVAGITFTDILDIVIVSFCVYKILGFIRRSRAQQLAQGIVLILVVFIASDLLNLYALNWILSKIISVGIIALVVVFQPELRRGLEYLGRGRLGKIIAGKEEPVERSATAVVDAIVASLDHFASIKEGALIIIEKQTALSDIAESGTILNAEISAELLENIFYVGSPMHDGAVIIRGDRVYAAGCVLPLTGNQNLSKDLGTRHRAAIGVSEVSDALVLVVSEETGIISMAEDGKITRFLDLKTVEKTLLSYYINKEKGNLPKFRKGGRNE